MTSRDTRSGPLAGVLSLAIQAMFDDPALACKLAYTMTRTRASRWVPSFDPFRAPRASSRATRLFTRRGPRRARFSARQVAWQRSGPSPSGSRVFSDRSYAASSPSTSKSHTERARPARLPALAAHQDHRWQRPVRTHHGRRHHLQLARARCDARRSGAALQPLRGRPSLRGGAQGGPLKHRCSGPRPVTGSVQGAPDIREPVLCVYERRTSAIKLCGSLRSRAGRLRFRGGRAVRRGWACGPWTPVRRRLTEVCYTTHDHESPSLIDPLTLLSAGGERGAEGATRDRGRYRSNDKR